MVILALSSKREVVVFDDVVTVDGTLTIYHPGSQSMTCRGCCVSASPEVSGRSLVENSGVSVKRLILADPHLADIRSGILMSANRP